MNIFIDHFIRILFCNIENLQLEPKKKIKKGCLGNLKFEKILLKQELVRML